MWQCWPGILLFAIGCSRYRTVPVSEAPKLSANRFLETGNVVVRDVDGRRVRINNFRILEVPRQDCTMLAREAADVRCKAGRARLLTPLGLDVSGSTLFVQLPNRPEASPTRFEGVREITLVDRSFTRGPIVVGSAVIATVAVYVGTVLLVQQLDPSAKYHPLKAFLPAALTGTAAGVGAIVIMLPLTADLGEDVSP
jgi:hypothetical protein